MTYDFRLDKKAAISLLAGWAILGVLLFAAGWTVGIYSSTGGSNAAAATSGKAASTSENEQAALSKEPVIREDASQPEIAAPGKATGTTRQGAVRPGGVAGATKQPGADPAGSAANQIATAPAVDDQEKVIQTAAPEPPASATPEASATGDNAVVNSKIFTIQVGAFLQQNEANRLLNAMERRGYAPSFFADRDAENRQWYVVRIGAYADKDQAVNAAANFSRQEKIKAVVRPLGSL